MSTIETTTEFYGGGDYRWLAAGQVTVRPVPGTVDLTSFDGDTEEEITASGVLPSGLPLKFDSESGLYVQADDEDTVDTLAGFNLHNRPIKGTKAVVAILTDATIVPAHVPGEHDLAAGRYITDLIQPAGGAS